MGVHNRRRFVVFNLNTKTVFIAFLVALTFLSPTLSFAGSSLVENSFAAKFEGTSLVRDTEKVRIGGAVDFSARLNAPNNTVVLLYVGDSNAGTTTVTIGGQTVVLPVAQAVQADAGALLSGKTTLSWQVPHDKQLIGTTKTAVAVTVSAGQIIVTNLAPSGPILGDDIS